MSEDDINGKLNCGLMNGSWSQYQKEFTSMASKIETIHDGIEEFKGHVSHLSKLDTIADAVVDMKDNLVSVATGRSQIPLDVAKELFSQNRQGSNAITKILSAVIVLLLAVIGFLLIGESSGLIRKLFTP